MYEPSSARRAVVGDSDFNQKIQVHMKKLDDKKEKVEAGKFKLEQLREKHNKSPSTREKINKLEKWVEVTD